MMHIGRIAMSAKDLSLDEIGANICVGIEMFCNKNKIKLSHISAIIFSQTSDISTWNPAQQLRRHSAAFSDIALFCTSEPEYLEGVLEMGVRMMVFYQKFSFLPHKSKALYILGAEKLRPDLMEDSSTE